MSDENSENLIEEIESDVPQYYNKTLRLMKISAGLVTSENQVKESYRFLNSNPIWISFPFFICIIAISQVFIFIILSIKSGTMNNICIVNSQVYFDSYPSLFLPFTLLHDDFFHLMKTLIILTVFGMPQEIVFGGKVIGSLFIVGLITTTVFMQAFFPKLALCGASGGIYTIIFFQLVNWILNRNEMPYAKFQIRFIGVIMLYDVAKLFIYIFASGNFVDHMLKYIIDRGNTFIIATLFGYIFVHHNNEKKRRQMAFIYAFSYFLLFGLAASFLAVHIKESEVQHFN